MVCLLYNLTKHCTKFMAVNCKRRTPLPSFEQVLLLSTASPHWYRGRCWAAIRLSHRPEPSGRVVRGRPMDWRTTWSTVCSAPHSQATEEVIPLLYRQEQKRPTPVRRRLSPTQALFGRVIPGVCVPVSGMKVRSLVGLSAYSAFHWWSAHCVVRMLLLSEKLMSCAAGTNGRLDLRRRTAAHDGRVRPYCVFPHVTVDFRNIWQVMQRDSYWCSEAVTQWQRHFCANWEKGAKDEWKCTFVANSHTAPYEKDFKIDANGARGLMGHFLFGEDSDVVKTVTFEIET